MAEDSGDTIRLLLAAARNERDAADRLLPQIYSELRALAAHYLKGERPGHTLQPTALVHEAYLRLVRIDQVDWEGKNHFFAMAAREMRRVLVDHARRRGADKRGGDWDRVTLSERIAEQPDRVVDVLALDQALDRVAVRHERRARVAELRLFAGLDIGEIAAALGIKPRTAKEDWKMARAWLGRELRE